MCLQCLHQSHCKFKNPPQQPVRFTSKEILWGCFFFIELSGNSFVLLFYYSFFSYSVFVPSYPLLSFLQGNNSFRWVKQRGSGGEETLCQLWICIQLLHLQRELHGERFIHRGRSNQNLHIFNNVMWVIQKFESFPRLLSVTETWGCVAKYAKLWQKSVKRFCWMSVETQ